MATEAIDVPSPCGRPLQLVLDDMAEKIVVRMFTEFSGEDLRLLRVLRREAKEDLVNELAPVDYKFVSSDQLAEELGIEEATVRKRVSKCRSKFAKHYLERCGKEPSQDVLIETRHGRGYRLNPWVRFVAPTELQ